MSKNRKEVCTEDGSTSWEPALNSSCVYSAIRSHVGSAPTLRTYSRPHPESGQGEARMGTERAPCSSLSCKPHRGSGELVSSVVGCWSLPRSRAHSTERLGLSHGENAETPQSGAGLSCTLKELLVPPLAPSAALLGPGPIHPSPGSHPIQTLSYPACLPFQLCPANAPRMLANSSTLGAFCSLKGNTSLPSKSVQDHKKRCGMCESPPGGSGILGGGFPQASASHAHAYTRTHGHAHGQPSAPLPRGLARAGDAPSPAPLQGAVGAHRGCQVDARQWAAVPAAPRLTVLLSARRPARLDGQ